MNDLEFLNSYRSIARELRLMHTQRDQLTHRLAQHRHDTNGTSQLTAHINRLDRMIVEADARMAEREQRFSAVLARVQDERMRLILQHYYGLALSEAEVADVMEYSPRTVSRYRSHFLHAAQEDTSA